MTESGGGTGIGFLSIETLTRGLGGHIEQVRHGLKALEQARVVPRIWDRDHTVWRPGPTEISNRLGWLTAPEEMTHKAAELKTFASDAAGSFDHVVLLGMGGSSLGPEALRRSLGPSGGYPKLIVLDSTVPACVQRAAESIDPARTLFIVSSKSGGTIETLSLYSYFRDLAAKRVGDARAGASFVAVTDPGTPLERIAGERGFRKVFFNPTDIGGRYSVLSNFGMAPAALAGMDLEKLLESAVKMASACGPDVPLEHNPAAWLGAALGALAVVGRDKVTLVSSKGISSVGLWIEQLIAESTGKEGRGIIPVAEEPLLGPEAYGDDRLFVYLRLAGDDNHDSDLALQDLESAGHPVLRLELEDVHDLGAQFYLWEMAVAVAGSILKINPFDQPDVQSAKDMTDSIIEQWLSTGLLPEMDSKFCREALEGLDKGNYLALLAYTDRTPEMDRAAAELREAVMKRFKAATAFDHGPRYLHSTGQLHKGGPNSGVFVMTPPETAPDLPIPGSPYTFGTLASAQALGDMNALRAANRRMTHTAPGGAGIDALLETARWLEETA